MKSKIPGCFCCGHPKTPENTTTSGPPQCRQCKREYSRRYRAASFDATRRRTADLAAEPAIALYRTEKAKREERRAAELQPVKQALQAVLDREKEARKGGRPRGSGKGGMKSMTIHQRPFFAKRVDPVDALVESLGHFNGNAL